MVKISIVSGFLGAGKTTLIKKLLGGRVFGDAPILIENDYGSLGIDSRIIRDTGVQVIEMTAGCICCSLTGNFVVALEDLIREKEPSQIVIEPSGVGKLSEILETLTQLNVPYEIGPVLTLADTLRFFYHDRYVNEYFWDQIRHADMVVLTKTEGVSQDTLGEIHSLIQTRCPGMPILYDPTGESLVSLFRSYVPVAGKPPYQKPRHPAKRMRGTFSAHTSAPLQKILPSVIIPCGQEGFQSWSTEISMVYDDRQLHRIIDALNNRKDLGTILRVKGIFRQSEGAVLLDYVPGEGSLSTLLGAEAGRVIVIGKGLDFERLEEVFLYKDQNTNT